MYHLLSIEISNKADMFFLGFVAFAFFLFGLFLGKNNGNEVQKLGEIVEKDASEAKDAIVKNINQNKL